MCEPTTIAGTAIVAGTLVNAYGQYKAGQAQAAQADRNAQRLEQQAGFVKQEGAQAAGQARAAGRQAAGEARVVAASSGVDPNSGSAANAATASLINSEIDAAKLKANAARQAWGYKEEAKDLRKQGQMAKKQGILNAFGAGLSGAGSVASLYKGEGG